MKVSIQAAALADLERIFEWISRDSPVNARSVTDRILDAIETTVASFPFIGRNGRRIGTREWVVTGLPYIVIYEVDTARRLVIVRAVYHTAQQR